MTNFITLSSGQLHDGSNVFRFAGANAYWLGLSDHVSIGHSTQIDYPSHAQIDDALNTAKEMGLSVVRSHTLGISVGNSKSIWPNSSYSGSPQYAAFEPIDYAINKASTLGLRLIIPLTDNHKYYHGGLYTFTGWTSVADAAFYTDTTTINLFKAYISDLLGHTNQYSSIALKNDPTILCWETGNELMPLGNTSDYTAWVSNIAYYIKGIDSNHLVMDGTTGTIPTANFSLYPVDIFTGHFYPLSLTQATADSSSAHAQSKTYIVGEYDWRANGNVSATTTIDTDHSGYGGPNSAKTVVSTKGAYDYQYQINQAGGSYFQLTNGTSYTFSFYAKQSSGLSTFPIRAVVQGNASPWKIYAESTFNVTTTWTQYSLTFTAPNNDTNIFIGFNLAAQVGTIWLDATSFHASGGSNLIQNPNFYSSLPPWVVNQANSTVDLNTFTSTVEGNSNIAGDLAWNIWPHDEVYGYVKDNDLDSIYYPIGQVNQWNPDTNQPQIFEHIRQHGFTMRGSSSARITPAAPTLTVKTSGTTDTIYWAGVVGGMGYNLVTGTTNTGPWSTVYTTSGNSVWTDFDLPAHNNNNSVTTYYKVQAFNYDNTYGSYSSVATNGTSGTTPPPTTGSGGTTTPPPNGNTGTSSGGSTTPPVSSTPHAPVSPFNLSF